MLQLLIDWLNASWTVISLSATWLMFGFLFAGVIHVLMPHEWVERHLKTKGLSSVLKSSAFGIPLPLCSCSVIPVGVSLRKKGASRGATASFFVSTPEIGVDSFLLSFALLGPPIAIVRVIASFVSAIAVGSAIDMLPDDSTDSTSPDTPASCCGHTEKPAPSSSKLLEAIRYGFVNVVDDLSKLLAIGFLAAGAVSAFVPEGIFSDIGLGPVGSVAIMLLVSLPLYVCATSSTPFAAALLAKGLSPGAALVFLLAGPATNAATMLVIRKELGRGALPIYLIGIGGIAVLSAVGMNAYTGLSDLQSPMLLAATHHHHGATFSFSGVVLIALMALSLFRTARAK